MILEEFDQETTKLLPKMISMESDTELSMYNIVKWQLIFVDDGNNFQEGKGRFLILVS